MSDVVLSVKGLRVELEASGADIDDEVEFTIHSGEVLGLVGESASGKTTAATALLVHQRRGAVVAGGEVVIKGRDILSLSPVELRKVRGGLASYVPQDPSMSLNPALRIGTQLREILEVHGFGASDAERAERIREMMAEVLLPGDRQFLRRYPHQLSGGMGRRVLTAMALAGDPALVVADEPTPGLTAESVRAVLDRLRGLADAGRGVLVVTHELSGVLAVADRVVVCERGRTLEEAPAAAFTGTGDRLAHPYSRALWRALPTTEFRTDDTFARGVAAFPVATVPAAAC